MYHHICAGAASWIAGPQLVPVQPTYTYVIDASVCASLLPRYK